jgi:hypothetical protein
VEAVAKAAIETTTAQAGVVAAAWRVSEEPQKQAVAARLALEERLEQAPPAAAIAAAILSDRTTSDPSFQESRWPESHPPDSRRRALCSRQEA